MKTLISLFLLSTFAAPSFAVDQSAAPAADKPGHPCRVLKEACVAAGFEKGKAKEGKGLFKDCLKKMLDGGPLSGVNVTAEQIAACKEKRASRMQNKANPQ